MNLSNQLKGVLAAATGILVISPDSLLIRFVNIDLWTLMFLRGLFIAIALFSLSLILNPPHSLMRQIRSFDINAWLMALLMGISSFFFVASIQTTSVAHTLIIVGSTPVFSAVLGLLILKERLPLNTWLTIVIVFFGLIFVVYDQQQSSLLGDLYALGTALSWCFILMLARKTSSDSMFLIMMFSGLVMFVVSLPFASLPSITLNQTLIGALLGTLNGIALSLLTLAPRFIPAAEVAVFLPLESVFGSLLVWWFLAEYPGHVSIAAGFIIILTIMINSYYQLKKSIA